MMSLKEKFHVIFKKCIVYFIVIGSNMLASMDCQIIGV